MTIKKKRTKTEPKWRKVAPTDLRFEEKVVHFGGVLFTSPKTRMVLQEKWERIHAGEVIDTAWLSVPTKHHRCPWEY